MDSQLINGLFNSTKSVVSKQALESIVSIQLWVLLVKFSGFHNFHRNVI